MRHTMTYSEVKDLIDNYGIDALRAYTNYFGKGYMTDEEFRYQYHGEWKSEQQFTENLIDDSEFLRNIPDTVRQYFDYEAYIRDLFVNDFIWVNGYVFSRY